MLEAVAAEVMHLSTAEVEHRVAAALPQAAAVGTVVIAGDLLDSRSAVALDVQAVAVTAALRGLLHRTTVFAASGNHDLDSRSEEEKVARWMRPLARDGVHVDYTSA